MTDRPISEYHCVEAAESRDSAVYGEVTEAVLDVDGEYVYRELLDVFEDDGYELVAVGASGDKPKLVFVYRGT